MVISGSIAMGKRGLRIDDTFFDERYQHWQLPKARTLPQHVIATITSLPTPSGFGLDEAFNLLPYQRTLIKHLYKQKNGKRVVKHAVVSVARGNGKTGLACMLLLYELLTRRMGELYIAASSKAQAGRTFQEMVRVISMVRPLAEKIHILNHTKELRNTSNGTFFKVLSSDSGRTLGLAPSFAVIDEMAAHKDATLYDSLKTAMGKKPNSQIIVTSTVSSTTQTGNPFDQLIEYAQHNQSPTFYSYVRSAPKNIDPFSMAAIRAANPAIGYLKHKDDLIDEARMAKTVAGREQAYRAYILNQRVTVQSTTEETWLDPKTIADLQAPVALPEYHGRDAVIGIDASSTRDLTAIATLILPTDEDNKHTLFVHSFLPRFALQEIKNQNLAQWHKDGHISIPDASERAIDQQVLYDYIIKQHNEFNVRGVGYDPWMLARLEVECGKQLTKAQVKAFAPVRQGFYTMSPLLKSAEALIFTGKLRVAQNPCLIWQLHNCIVDRDAAGNRKITRARCKDKVDAVMAFLCALAMANKQPSKPKQTFGTFQFTIGG